MYFRYIWPNVCMIRTCITLEFNRIAHILCTLAWCKLCFEVCYVCRSVIIGITYTLQPVLTLNSSISHWTDMSWVHLAFVHRPHSDCSGGHDFFECSVNRHVRITGVRINDFLRKHKGVYKCFFYLMCRLWCWNCEVILLFWWRNRMGEMKLSCPPCYLRCM